MRNSGSAAGFTVLEMLWAIVVISILSAIYYFLIDSYKDRRAGEQAARVLMLAAGAEEDFFTRERRYFDADVAGNGGDTFLVTPDGVKTSVNVPSKVVLSIKTRGKEKTAFTGYAFFTGSKVLHKYDSQTGKMTTVSRTQDETG